MMHLRRALPVCLLATFLLTVLPGVIPPAATAQSPEDPLPTAMEAAKNTALAMPRAIDYADWEGFLSLFAEDAIMYYPFMPQRANNREEIAAVMKPLFERNKQRLPGPLFNFEPVDVRVQMLGDKGAVVTWIMVRPTDTARRTAVLRKDGNGWRIIIVHADNWNTEPDN